MRTSSLIAAAVLACGLAFAGHTENVVYTDGNLTGINPHTIAVLDLSQDTAMKLRVGRTDVSVPYASITGTNAPAPDSSAAKSGKSSGKPAQALTIQFNSAQGEPRTMTLELSKPAVSHVLATIHKHAPANTTVAAAQTTPAGQSAAPQDQADKSKAKAAKKDKNNKDKQEVAANKTAPKKTWSCHPDLPVDCAKDDWWGDNTWKTNRNAAKWEQPSTTAAAQ